MSASSPGKVFLEYGPVRMEIDAFAGGRGDTERAVRIAEEVEREFDRVAVHMDRLRAMRAFRETDPALPAVLNKMILAIEAVGEGDLNTLAAVAGAFAEYAAEFGACIGCDRVVANNGGDIAIHNAGPGPVRVGIPLPGGRLAGMDIRPGGGVAGICTSGRGGRSFTKGIASSVTVLAATASLADAAATAVANATNVDSPEILRAPAEEIDSGTDIAGQLVTLRVGPLSREEKARAVLNGADAARRLADSGVIAGALVCLDELALKVPDRLPIEIGAASARGRVV